MTGQEYIRILEAQNKLMIELLSDALMALHDLGACDDPECSDRGCLRVLQRIRQVLAITPPVPPVENAKRYKCALTMGPYACIKDKCSMFVRLLDSGLTEKHCPYWREIKEEG